MYGTIARMKVKSGQMSAFKKVMDDFNANRHPKGYSGQIIYQMDSDPNEIMLAVFFADKASYQANASDPEMNKEYERYRALLDADPEWNDGEVIHQFWMK